MMSVGMRKALMGAALLLLVTLAVYFLRGFLMQDKPSKKPVIQQISLLKPPPPPKPEEKPPEPEIKKEEVKIDEPQPVDAPKEADNQPPPGQNLGVDADGSAGGDGFGLVGRKGGRDLLAGAGGKFGFFTNVLRQQVNEAMYKDKRLRGVDFKAVVRLWLGRDGRLEKYELSGSSGNADTDNAIKVALSNMPVSKELPPEDMPQPIKLRITSRL